MYHKNALGMFSNATNFSLFRHVTRRELMFIIASIKPMEHCLVPFLNECDANDDHTIDLMEWGTCLGIGMSC